jgi:peroxiredoxin
MTVHSPNTQAPSLQMVDLAGNSIHLRDFAGQKNVVIVLMRGLF